MGQQKVRSKNYPFPTKAMPQGEAGAGAREGAGAGPGAGMVQKVGTVVDGRKLDQPFIVT